MKKKWMQSQFILLLAICIMLSGCKKIDLPKWQIFREDIKASYLDVKSVRLSVYNTPTLSVYITGKNIDNKEIEEIMKKIVDFILSDEGFIEMEEYFVESHRMGAKEFHSIQINFIDTDYDDKKPRIRYSSRREDETKDEDHRGYIEWRKKENDRSETIDIFNTQ